MNQLLRSSVECAIRNAFQGVTLGRGISLRQAQLIDSRDIDRNTDFASLARQETTDDWSRVPFEELERNCVAHLDAPGFRYYIPALMLSVLSHYDSSSMRVIGTLTGLYPKQSDVLEYHTHRYSLFTPDQKAAIARFLTELPKLVELDSEDQKIVERALRNYWSEYLQTAQNENG